MSAPEKIAVPETKILQTEMPEVVLREYRPEDIEELTELAMKNLVPLTVAKIQAGGLISMAEETAEGYQPQGSHRMGIWMGDKIVGGVNIGLENDKEMDISYFVDKDYAKRGIARAAVKAVVNWQTTEGNNFIAHVKADNFASVNLLKKVGFEFKKHDWSQSEDIYKLETQQASNSQALSVKI